MPYNPHLKVKIKARYITTSSKLAQAVMPLIYILHMICMNLGWDTAFPGSMFLVVFLSPSIKIPG
jgi:hypothetical protein